ncbi:sodium:proton antiporter [uncultured Halomonas sp.]|uniref:nickel/cobalt transporter n=1 Tax=uncultured Halomonas sp. TaxID=173971 RepID=UPI002612D241|nr:sodium:proton antiporter [uncultured Halomonas sp.]
MSRHASSLTSSAGPAGVSYRLRGFLIRHRWRLGGLALLVIVAALLMQFGVMRGLSLQILAWQRDLHRALTLAVGGWSEMPSWATAGWLLALSFGYGVFHAAGPGHGKAVLSTYLVSQGGGLKRALGLSFSAALLQGMMAIAMVLVLVQGLGWLTRRAVGSVASLELASFLMVALLGAWLCLRAWRLLRRTKADGGHGQHDHHHAHHHEHGHSHAHGHQHDGCGCGSRHHLAPEEVGNWRTALATVVVIGLRPCTGAVLMMGAASLLGHAALGATAVMVMALGTAMTVSALALASVLARDWVIRHYGRFAGGAARLGRLSGWLAMGGGLAILWLGVSLAWQVGSAPTGGLPLLS